MTEQPPRSAEKEDLWRAYEHAQKFYEADLQLFSTRMNLFFVVNGALITVAVAAVGRNSGNYGLHARDRLSAGVLGLLLCVVWFLVALSSYEWILEWRRQLATLGAKLKLVVNVSLAVEAFDSSTAKNPLGRAAWRVRPTLWTCLLPLLFMGAWVYVAWLA
ncbi:MAG: hypothetical protein M3256_24620 [Actinomycetota bacterium]|nr:hypothetical protein [Actinomycetota bacterium]